MSTTEHSTPRDAESGCLVIFWRNLGPYHVARARATAELLKSKNCKTIVIELTHDEATRGWQVDRSEAGFDVRTVAPEMRLDDKAPDMSRRLTEILDELNPTHLAVAGYDRPEMRTMLRWANQRGKTAILMSDTKWDDRPRRWWRLLFTKHWVNRADAALVAGAAAGEFLVSLGFARERIFRHTCVVDNEFFAREAARCRAENNRTPGELPAKYFLVCCRLIESRKNIKRLLSAYHAYQTRQSTNTWGLVICGDGEDRDELEAFAKSLSLRDAHFVGSKQVEDLVRYYAHASGFVHPAINEAWGLVINEAMASGLPVLVSRRCGATYDLVSDGVNGFSFDPYDVDELSTYLQKISDMDAARLQSMGCASQKIIRAWGVDRFADGLWQAMIAGAKFRAGGA